MLRTLGKEEQSQSEIRKNYSARWFLPTIWIVFPCRKDVVPRLLLAKDDLLGL